MKVFYSFVKDGIKVKMRNIRMTNPSISIKPKIPADKRKTRRPGSKI